MGTTPMPMVQVFAPDGTLGDIPYDRLHDALGQGAKIAAKVKAPDGTVGFVPGDRVPDALKAGGQRVPLDMNEVDGGKKDGFYQRLTATSNPAVANSNPIIRGLDSAGGAVMATPEAIYNTVRHPIDTAKGIGSSVSGAVKGYTDPNLTANAVRSVLPEALGQGIGNVAGGEMMGASGNLARAGVEALPSADAIGTALRTPEGKLIQPVKVGAKVAGAAAGHALGIPGAGELGGYLVGDKLADMLVPDRPGAATAAERRAIPVSKNPTPGGYTGPASAQAANSVQPLNPMAGPAYPTADQLAQGVRLSDLVGEKPSGITVVPEPRAPFAGETPNYMASVPRDQLGNLALAGKPGAGTQLQQLGQPILYAPSGAGISNLKSSVALRDLLGSQPGDFAKPTSNIKLSAGEDLGPGLGTEHTIHTPDGKRIGSVTVEPKGDGVLHVNWLGGDLAGNATRSDIMNALKQEYPGTTKLTYDRRRLAAGADAATTEPREMNVGSGS